MKVKLHAGLRPYLPIHLLSNIELAGYTTMPMPCHVDHAKMTTVDIVTAMKIGTRLRP